MNLKGLNLAGIQARPILPASKLIPAGSKEAEDLIRQETHITDATIAASDAIIDATPGGATSRGNLMNSTALTESNISDENEKLDRLVEDDFPFDDSQLGAVYGLVQQQFGCLIGAAGTGKTTVSKKFVDLLRDGIGEIDIKDYWRRGTTDEHDDYEAPEKLIPPIVMVSFTGRASQMTKKNFPRDWHSNIMTIHRALGFYPEFYAAFDDESGEMRNKRRFVPAYDESNKMPWKIIIIDESGMLGVELWHQLYAACEPDTRIYMIGDIQQLPPTHGKSILGFALAEWPTWELTHIHRQKGANNSIVDNAHRVLKGQRPIGDSPTDLSFKDQKSMIGALNYMVSNKDWRFLMVEVPEDHRKASLAIRQGLKLLQGKLYEPNRDVVITPINGYEQTQTGFSLGQSAMNQELVVSLNSGSPRYIIDAGRERMNFAVGDKVMATVNDYEAGITNGMTGIVTAIAENGGYIGDPRRYGLISEVSKFYEGLADEIEDADPDDFSLEEMVSQTNTTEKVKEARDSGPASHLVTVQFGEGEHGFDLTFGSKSQVASLMLAYVATCHKMQGGEAPLVFTIVHQTHKRPLNREWLYTAITRASGQCVIFYTKQGVGFSLGKQNIKGVTLAQKVQTFIELTRSGLVGAAMRVKLPKKFSYSGEGPLTFKEINRQGPSAAVESQRPVTINVKNLTINITNRVEAKPEQAKPKTVDGGDVTPKRSWNEVIQQEIVHTVPKIAPQLPAPAKLVSQWGAIHMKLHLDASQDGPRLLTHVPKPVAKAPVLSLANLITAQKRKP